jgi:hypothetical protein
MNITAIHNGIMFINLYQSYWDLLRNNVMSND